MTAAAPEPTSPPTTADLGSSSGGVWTRGQARACGVTDEVIDARLRLGYWQLLRPGVYCDGGITPTPAVRGWAAVLASGGPGRAWADGRTTLRLFGLPLIDDDDPATGAADAEHDDVAVHRSRAPRQLETLHRHRRRRPFEVGVLHGCPSVSLEEALLSAAGVLTLEALICTLDAALYRGVLTTDRLDGLIARSAGRRHVAALRRAADLADGRAESPAETLLRLLLLPHLPGLVPRCGSMTGQAGSWPGSTSATSGSAWVSRPTGAPATRAAPWWPRTASGTSAPSSSVGGPSAARGSRCAAGSSGC